MIYSSCCILQVNTHITLLSNYYWTLHSICTQSTQLINLVTRLLNLVPRASCLFYLREGKKPWGRGCRLLRGIPKCVFTGHQWIENVGEMEKEDIPLVESDALRATENETRVTVYGLRHFRPMECLLFFLLTYIFHLLVTSKCTPLKVLRIFNRNKLALITASFSWKSSVSQTLIDDRIGKQTVVCLWYHRTHKKVITNSIT